MPPADMGAFGSIACFSPLGVGRCTYDPSKHGPSLHAGHQFDRLWPLTPPHSPEDQILIRT